MHSIDNNKALDLTDRKDASRSHRLRVPAHPLACCLDPRRQPPHIRGRAPPAPRARYLEEERDIAAVVLAAREAFFCPDHLDLARVLPGDAHACVVAVLVDADDHLRRARKVGTAPSCGPRRQCSALARADPRATSAAESAATRGHVCMHVCAHISAPPRPPASASPDPPKRTGMPTFPAAAVNASVAGRRSVGRPRSSGEQCRPPRQPRSPRGAGSDGKSAAAGGVAQSRSTPTRPAVTRRLSMVGNGGRQPLPGYSRG